MKLLVAIPTWNRADHLDTAISAIAAARAMTQKCDVELFISDNCSSDHTAEVVARWQEGSPWIHYRRWEEHAPRGTPVLQRAFLGMDLEYDYLWLQGDDDYISDLSAYEILAGAIEASAGNPPAIVHACATRRATPGDQRIIAGTTEELCNIYGWHDLLGWISSLVMSRDTVARMWASPHAKIQPPSSYYHSELLLEAGYGRTMLILATGLIEPQDTEQTAESVARWALADVGNGYWRIIPGLLSLRERGVLTTPLTLNFFRYLTYSFWDRFAVEVMELASMHETTQAFLSSRLELLNLLALLLGHSVERKLFENWLHGLREDVGRVRQALQLVSNRIEDANRPSYPFRLLPPPEVEEKRALSSPG
jgi:hypothetical protein